MPYSSKRTAHASDWRNASNYNNSLYAHRHAVMEQNQSAGQSRSTQRRRSSYDATFGRDIFNAKNGLKSLIRETSDKVMPKRSKRTSPSRSKLGDRESLRKVVATSKPRRKMERSCSFNDLSSMEMDDNSHKGFHAMFGGGKKKNITRCSSCEDLEKNVAAKSRVRKVFGLGGSENSERDSMNDSSFRRLFLGGKNRHRDDSDDDEDEDSLDPDDSFSSTGERLWSMIRGPKKSMHESDSVLSYTPTRQRGILDMFSRKRSSELEDDDVLYSFAICKGLDFTD